ncbi:MAG: PqqD family protein [Bacteroidales bacterium]|nr:PqqD family protein [Bacteroidales bacterium]
MRIKKDIKLRKIGGVYMIVNLSDPTVNLANVLSLNETAAELWREFRDRDFQPSDLASWLCAHYDVDAPTAQSDINRLLDTWREAGIFN